MAEASLAKAIAGEITLSDNPAKTLKKWREIFGANQKQLAERIRVSASVISDYESGRRKNPGAIYIKKTVEALLTFDSKKGGELAQRLNKDDRETAILDLREFLEPITARKLIEKVKGKVVSGGNLSRVLWGYTVVDSIQAILSLSHMEFAKIYGSTTERALVFTKVGTGRSPMIALKVTQPKPAVVVLHGLSPSSVDKLAIKIAGLSEIPLVVSTIRGENKLIESLRSMIS
jgi:putative transcriptional regulator